MEVEKRKNKKVMREEKQEHTERVKFKKLKGQQQQDEQQEEEGVPTEEEVEEFFAILRRMRVAVKYFDHRGMGGREWLETPDLAVDHSQEVVAGADDDDRKNNKKGGQEIINEGFDLNAVAPEAAENGGA